MSKEYLFISKTGLDPALGENIEISRNIPHGEFLVANCEAGNCLIYAPEIDFYLDNTQDQAEDKIHTVNMLYEARATGFDFSQKTETTIEVGNTIVLLTDKKETTLVEQLREYNFNVLVVDVEILFRIHGSLGGFEVQVTNKGQEKVIYTDQIIWPDAPSHQSGRQGIYDPLIVGMDETVASAGSNLGTRTIRHFVKYNSSLCHYHDKRTEVCGKCVEVCPLEAIQKLPQEKVIKVSHLDCSGCGACIGSCPTGSLDCSFMPRNSFAAISSLYRSRIPLVIDETIKINDIKTPLGRHIAPLIIPGAAWLDEGHFLTLLQSCGNQVVVYSEKLHKSTREAIDLLNDIFLRKYGKKAIYICQKEQELEDICASICQANDWKVALDELGMTKKQIVSARLSLVIGEDNLGAIVPGDLLNYGDISLESEHCTLCLSCVDCCDTHALSVGKEDNSLRFNASLCTGCGYCEITCPENRCLSVHTDSIQLNQEFFVERILTRDELFKCVECGVGFAPAKSIAKIADLMKPLFGADTLKVKSLSCCPECKAKIMLEAQHQLNLETKEQR